MTSTSDDSSSEDTEVNNFMQSLRLAALEFKPEIRNCQFFPANMDHWNSDPPENAIEI